MWYVYICSDSSCWRVRLYFLFMLLAMWACGCSGACPAFLNFVWGGRESVSTCPAFRLWAGSGMRGSLSRHAVILSFIVGRLASRRYCMFTRWFLIMFLLSLAFPVRQWRGYGIRPGVRRLPNWFHGFFKGVHKLFFSNCVFFFRQHYLARGLPNGFHGFAREFTNCVSLLYLILPPTYIWLLARTS